ncbi:G-protein beta WD-40 repeat-containing protein, partial [Cynara cardunculus var. scolymus]
MEEDDGKMEMDKLEILGNHIDVETCNLESQRFSTMASMNRHGESSRQADTRPIRISDTGFLGNETNARNYSLLNPNIASSSGTREYIRQGSRYNFPNLVRASRSNPCGHFGSQEGEPTLMVSQKDLSSLSLDPANGKAWWANQDPKEQPSDSLPLRDKRLKVSSSVNFSDFVVRQSTRGMGILCESAGITNEFNAAEMTQDTDKKDLISRMTTDISLDLSGQNVDFPQETSNKGIPEPYIQGMSLRKWLKNSSIEVNKAERLQIYRQVVQTVDMAHSQGNALQGLWLSSFILLPSNEIIYFDSSTEDKVMTITDQNNGRKWGFEQGSSINCQLDVKQQKAEDIMNQIGEKLHSSTHQATNSKFLDKLNSRSQGLHGLHFNHGHGAQNNRKHKPGPESYSVDVELEKNWYACPEELYGRDLLSANVYSLGILLFELLCSFVSLEMHSAAISDLRNRILPPSFISENPQEAGFCLWLLHPQPSSRPTTRDILQSELLSGTKEVYFKSNLSSIVDKNEDVEFEILLDFLISLKEQKEKHALELCGNIQFLETDIKNFQHENVLRMFYDSDILEERMKTYISQLESAYFSKKSQLQLPDTVSNGRNDLDLLGNRERCSLDPVGVKEPTMKEKYVGFTDDFLNSICKFIRYSKFEACGTLKMGNLLNSANVICSLSFDRDENYIAAAGVSKKIKIFDFDSLLHDSIDVNYPAVELLNQSKLSCVCWNKYLKNCLASADYEGVVQVWDAFTGQGLSHYREHQRRAWCVEFSHVDPTQFASGSDDCSVKLWSLNEKTSTCTIRSAANVCCVQFSSRSSHLLAFGSADYKIHCYDLRHTRIPWCTLAGHQKAVSYVKFLGSDSLVSASTDNTLKLWDLKKTSLEGLSTDACCVTYRGHTNVKNFVGLSVLDGYIACGSESNEVYAYHRSFSMPIISYKFGSIDPIAGDENGDGNAPHFVSSVCWREKTNMIVAANSGGSIK